MKYDIVKNDEGPLRRPVNGQVLPDGLNHTNREKGKQMIINLDEEGEGGLPERHPGLENRLAGIENYFSVRYGKSHRHYDYIYGPKLIAWLDLVVPSPP